MSANVPKAPSDAPTEGSIGHHNMERVVGAPASPVGSAVGGDGRAHSPGSSPSSATSSPEAEALERAQEKLGSSDGSRARRLLDLDRRASQLDTREKRLAQHEARWLTPQQRTAVELERIAHATVEEVRSRQPEFPTLVALGIESEVVKYQRALYERTGRLVPGEEVARSVEDYYAGLAERAHAASRSARSRTPQPARQPDLSDNRPLSDDERWRRALEVMGLTRR